MEESSSTPKNKLPKKIISIILIIIGIIIIGGFFWFVFSQEEVTFMGGTTNSSKEVNGTADTNTNISNANTIPEEQKDNPEAKARDEQRITQVKEIQSALSSFYKDKGNYPEKMDELVSEGYLSEIPKNPTPGGIDYVYTPIGSLPAQYYDLAYSLEVGTDGVEAGEQIANPSSIGQP